MYAMSSALRPPEGIGAIAGLMPGIYNAMVEFAAENGVDTSDQAALAEAMGEPGFQQEFQRALQENPEMLEQLTGATGLASFIGFWLVILAFAIWFSRMSRQG